MSNISIYPYITYDFKTRLGLSINPFITYKLDGAIDFLEYPFITFIDHTLGGKKIDRIYYCIFYSNYMKKIIKCRLYNSTKYFPLKNVHMSVLCDDGKRRYLPLNKLESDFDSGVRVRDKYGNELQVCVARQENIMKKYFDFGNLLIPLTTYNDLYATLVGIFGKAYVKVSDDGKGLCFSPPSEISGITKFLVVGLNVRITSMFGHTLTTYNNGLSRTSFGGDAHWIANTMLIRMRHREKFKIEFDNSYYGTSYDQSAIVKNALVFGRTIESFPSESSSYNLLVKNNRWLLFDVKNNTVNQVDTSNAYIRYFRDKYLQYPNSIRMYNYYDLHKWRVKDR